MLAYELVEGPEARGLAQAAKVAEEGAAARRVEAKARKELKARELEARNKAYRESLKSTGGHVALPNPAFPGWTSAVDPHTKRTYYISPDRKSQWEHPALTKAQEEAKAKLKAATAAKAEEAAPAAPDEPDTPDTPDKPDKPDKPILDGTAALLKGSVDAVSAAATVVGQGVVTGAEVVGQGVVTGAVVAVSGAATVGQGVVSGVTRLSQGATAAVKACTDVNPEHSADVPPDAATPESSAAAPPIVSIDAAAVPEVSATPLTELSEMRIQELRVAAGADNVPIEYEAMRLWTEAQVVVYFGSNGNDRPTPTPVVATVAPPTVTTRAAAAKRAAAEIERI